MDELAVVTAWLGWQPFLAVLKHDSIVRKSQTLTAIDSRKSRSDIHISPIDNSLILVRDANIPNDKFFVSLVGRIRRSLRLRNSIPTPTERGVIAIRAGQRTLSSCRWRFLATRFSRGGRRSFGTRLTRHARALRQSRPQPYDKQQQSNVASDLQPLFSPERWDSKRLF
jgi:hypothetical protein